MRIFTDAPSLSRLCLPGLMLMAVGVLLVALAGRLAKRYTDGKTAVRCAMLRVAGLAVCAGGALLAIMN